MLPVEHRPTAAALVARLGGFGAALTGISLLSRLRNAPASVCSVKLRRRPCFSGRQTRRWQPRQRQRAGSKACWGSSMLSAIAWAACRWAALHICCMCMRVCVCVRNAAGSSAAAQQPPECSPPSPLAAGAGAAAAISRCDARPGSRSSHQESADCEPGGKAAGVTCLCLLWLLGVRL